MNELFQITSSAKDSQIKGLLQLKDLNEIVNFIYIKFDEYEKERKKIKQIKNLEENVSRMKLPCSNYPVQCKFQPKFLYIRETEMPGDFLVNLIDLVSHDFIAFIARSEAPGDLRVELEMLV